MSSHMESDAFIRIEAAAHSGDFGQYSRKIPTPEQCKSGNYKVGKIDIHGLPVSIEQPRNSTRSGKDRNGTQWQTRMAAHYGYIRNTRGNDGDHVDCFIGFDPQSQAVWVINQNVAGKFDEHKVMLNFPDEDSARRAYLASYSHDWDGLASMVPVSIGQLKWWLKHGNMSAPLRPDAMPQLVLDAVHTIRPLERLKLSGELARVKVGLKGANNALARLKQAARANQIRVQLGAGKTKPAAPKTGKFGPIYDQFRHDAKGAIAHLMKHRTGEATAALHHAAVGDIDMIWGKEGTASNDYEDGFGLAKIVRKHPEVLGDLQGFLNGLDKNEASSGRNKVVLESSDKKVVVSLDWFGQQKTWLLTAYEKKTRQRMKGGSASPIALNPRLP